MTNSPIDGILLIGTVRRVVECSLWEIHAVLFEQAALSPYNGPLTASYGVFLPTSDNERRLVEMFLICQGYSIKLGDKLGIGIARPI